MRALIRRARRIRIGTALALVLLLDLVLLRVWDPPPVEMLRLRTFDLFQVIKPREAVQRPVVLVDIDEASLRALGQWPWPRTLLADLVTRLTALGALAVALDAVFSRTRPLFARRSGGDVPRAGRRHAGQAPGPAEQRRGPGERDAREPGHRWPIGARRR